ncbi:MAG: pyridoxal phosphate-dependent aminotransferase [Deltaproteobacteria bacterium]|nr:pyridoxal phosphate-dependent aminotransferase [Deltaproteobacteria bacterium]
MQTPGPRLSCAASTVRNSVFAALQSRIDAFRARGGELVPLQIGDTYLPPPAAAFESLRRLEVPALGTYGAVPGLPELRSALAGRLAERGHATVHGLDSVHVGAGCTHALFCAARALLDPGDEVLVVTPYWPLITGVLATAGAVPIEVPLTQELFDPPGACVRTRLERALGPRTRAIYFSSPGNPDGYVFPRAQLAAIAELAEAHDLWVFSDEVYADFVYEGAHEPFANLPGMANRTVTSHSLSKSHALAGARIGYVNAAPRVIDAVRRMSNHTIYNVPVTMQQAALAAVQASEPFLSDAARIYKEARDATCAELARHGLCHHVPRGGSFVFLDLTERLAGRSLQHALELAIDHGVLLAPGDAFGAAHTTSARLCFTGEPLPGVLCGVERLAAALDTLATENRT